jgi:hypothetical protein
MTGTAAHFIASILDKAGVKRIYGVAALALLQHVWMILPF